MIWVTDTLVFIFFCAVGSIIFGIGFCAGLSQETHYWMSAGKYGIGRVYRKGKTFYVSENPLDSDDFWFLKRRDLA